MNAITESSGRRCKSPVASVTTREASDRDQPWHKSELSQGLRVVCGSERFPVTSCQDRRDTREGRTHLGNAETKMIDSRDAADGCSLTHLACVRKRFQQG